MAHFTICTAPADPLRPYLEGVAEWDFDVARTRIGQAVEAGPKQTEERIRREIPACLPGGETHGWQLRLPAGKMGNPGKYSASCFYEREV